MLITSPRKLSVLGNFRARYLRQASLSRHPPARSANIAQQDCFRQPRFYKDSTSESRGKGKFCSIFFNFAERSLSSTKIVQEPRLKLVKIPNPSQNAVFNPILRLFLPRNPGEPGINFKYTENFRQNRLKFRVY